MNPTVHAVLLGVDRGWTEFKKSITSAQDQGFLLFIAVAVLGYLLLRRNTEVEGTSLLLPSVAMPGILGALIAFGLIVGAASQLSMEREDGTLLRLKAVPRGLVGYTTGQVVRNSLDLVPPLLVILVPGFFLFDDLMHRGAAGWATFAGVVVLGLLATLPIGLAIGSLVPSPQKLGTWGMLPVMALAGTSGIFYPVQELWGWVQGVVQAFPMYWLGLGMRSAFLPDAAAALELGGSWRTWQTVAVLGAWAVAGLLVTPVVLQRMARRQSGAAVAEAKETVGQWTR